MWGLTWVVWIKGGQDEDRVVGEKWVAIDNWFDAEPFADNYLPPHISGETPTIPFEKYYRITPRNTIVPPREILLQFFFRKENHPLPAPHLNLREYSRCDSPFTLAFDKYSAIPLHFPKKKWHSHILTPPLTTALQYELISQIGKVLPNFLFSHHHFVQNGKLQSFNFNLMWGRWWQPFYQNDKSEKWKKNEDVRNWSLMKTNIAGNTIFLRNYWKCFVFQPINLEMSNYYFNFTTDWIDFHFSFSSYNVWAHLVGSRSNVPIYYFSCEDIIASRNQNQNQPFHQKHNRLCHQKYYHKHNRLFYQCPKYLLLFTLAPSW